TLSAGSSSAADDQTCVAWIATWANADATVAAPVINRIQRLMAVSLDGQARAEALDAAIDLRSQPQALYSLARDLNQRGLYATSINAANRLAAASPAGSLESTPGCLRRLAYPLAFSDLVGAQASQNGLDPY